MKMVAIGLGKHDQAAYIYSYGPEGLRTLIPEFAAIALENSPAMFGLAILEDGCDATSDIVMVPREEIADKEPGLLRQAIGQMAALPFEVIDLLIVERMGKDISGTGMDTNVIGRYGSRERPDPPRPRVRTLVVLDITPASHGNATGVGLADLTTARLAQKIDQRVFYMNASTSGALERAKLPLVCPTDQAAIDLALRLLAPIPPEAARVVRIQDTLHIARFQASAALVEDDTTSHSISAAPRPRRLDFSNDGALC